MCKTLCFTSRVRDRLLVPHRARRVGGGRLARDRRSGWNGSSTLEHLRRRLRTENGWTRPGRHTVAAGVCGAGQGEHASL